MIFERVEEFGGCGSVWEIDYGILVFECLGLGFMRFVMDVYLVFVVFLI